MKSGKGRHVSAYSLGRRDFIRAAAIVPAATVLDLGCGSSSNPGEPSSHGAPDVLLGLYPVSSTPAPADALRAALAHVDFSWLGSGDSVLVKIASNSGNPHPASSAPAAVTALVAELQARGAGRIVVGEQSGCEYVRAVGSGQRFSSTSSLLEGNGLLAAIQSSGAEAHFFDDQGWDAHFAATLPPGSHWETPPMIPNVIKEVDHIVYLPRLSSHVLSGYTTGHKISVGWMRDDTRNDLHTRFDAFYEKYTELNYCDEIRSRFRLAVTFAEKMLLHYGPDTGTIYDLDPRVVIASRTLWAHEAVAVSLLVHESGLVTPTSGPTYSAASADSINQYFVGSLVPASTGLPWGPLGAADYRNLVPDSFESGLSEDRCLQRAWDIAGGRPETVRVILDGTRPAADVIAALESHSEGMFSLVG